MILIWSFTTKMEGGYKDPNPVLQLYKASMIRAKKLGYGIKLYGCDYTLKYLKGHYDNSFNVEKEEFVLTDDLKIYIHQREDLNCATIDGDLILKSKLPFDEYRDKDVIFEYPETRANALNAKRAMYIGYIYLLNIFKKYPIGDTIKEYVHDGALACNVGIIKFNNQKTKDLCINNYLAFRKYFLEIIEPKEKLVTSKYIPSIVICQYLFGCIVMNHNINVGYTKSKAQYDHYYGVWKFDKHVQKKAKDIIQFENTKKCLI